MNIRNKTFESGRPDGRPWRTGGIHAARQIARWGMPKEQIRRPSSSDLKSASPQDPPGIPGIHATRVYPDGVSTIRIATPTTRRETDEEEPWDGFG